MVFRRSVCIITIWLNAPGLFDNNHIQVWLGLGPKGFSCPEGRAKNIFDLSAPKWDEMVSLVDRLEPKKGKLSLQECKAEIDKLSKYIRERVIDKVMEKVWTTGVNDQRKGLKEILSSIMAEHGGNTDAIAKVGGGDHREYWTA